MAYPVEVHLVDRGLVDSMTEMRTWLDNRRCEPDTFRYAALGAGVKLRVEFKLAEEAAAFAEEFSGRVLAPRDGRRAGATGREPLGVLVDSA